MMIRYGGFGLKKGAMRVNDVSVCVATFHIQIEDVERLGSR